MQKLGIGLVVLLVLAIVGGLGFRMFAVTEVDSYELGYRYNRLSGRTTRINRTGYIPHWPLLETVHTIDLRPLQVCINGNARVLNCKLVRFNPEGLDTFLNYHGRDNYDASQLRPIMLSYAYEGTGRQYPFLTIMNELRSDSAPPSATVPAAALTPPTNMVSITVNAPPTDVPAAGTSDAGARP